MRSERQTAVALTAALLVVGSATVHAAPQRHADGHPVVLMLGICEPDSSCQAHEVKVGSYGKCLEMRRRLAAAAVPGIRAECSTSDPEASEQ